MALSSLARIAVARSVTGKSCIVQSKCFMAKKLFGSLAKLAGKRAKGKADPTASAQQEQHETRSRGTRRRPVRYSCGRLRG